jgi:hypothetical protein
MSVGFADTSIYSSLFHQLKGYEVTHLFSHFIYFKYLHNDGKPLGLFLKVTETAFIPGQSTFYFNPEDT